MSRNYAFFVVLAVAIVQGACGDTLGSTLQQAIQKGGTVVIVAADGAWWAFRTDDVESLTGETIRLKQGSDAVVGSVKAAATDEAVKAFASHLKDKRPGEVGFDVITKDGGISGRFRYLDGTTDVVVKRLAGVVSN